MRSELLVIVGLPFVVAGLVLLMPRKWGGWLAMVAPAIVAWKGLHVWERVASGGVVRVPSSWFPELGWTADLRADRLGAFFVLLIALVGLGVLQYSRHYLRDGPSRPYLAAMLGFMGSMLGIVVSDSLLLMFVFWELTTILSALLIGMEYGREDGRRGAVRAFLVTGAGGLAMLAGIVLLGQVAGTFNLSELAGRRAALLADPRHRVALGLLLVGAFTKSAQFPFHFWLPGAMAAPAPVSAYLHSATLVKGGVFLVARLLPVFGGSDLWRPALAGVGLATFLLAGWNALRAYDLKELLASSTSAYLGMVFAFYAYAPASGAKGELLLIATHALYKSALFLLIGWLEKATGTRDLSLLEREAWFRKNPLEAVLFAIGAGSMAGVPLLLGFVSKELFTKSLFGDPFRGVTPAVVAGVAAGTLSVAYALKVFVSTFFGPEHPPESRGYPPHKISWWLLVVPGIFLLPLVVGGLAPGWLAGAIGEADAWKSDGTAIWHGVDPKLGLSLLMFVVGAVLYWAWPRIEALPVIPGPQAASEALAGGVLGGSSWLSRALQSGGHPRYIGVILIATVAAMGAGVAWGGARPAFEADLGGELRLAWLPVTAVIGGALLTVLLRRRVSKLVVMALTGYGLAVSFLVFRAPDLALTQILAETVSLVLLLLIFRRLPPLGVGRGSDGRASLRVAGALVVGLAMGALAWGAGQHGAAERSGADQLARALPEAKGRNVVNVILVDFRGADTLGEIAVLAIAALGCLAMLRAARGRRSSPAEEVA